MNVLRPIHPSSFSEFPLHHHDVTQHHTDAHTSNSTMSTRKRKAEEEIENGMAISPTNSPPVLLSRLLTRPQKRVRVNEACDRPITIHRLLETLDAASLRSVLQTICERHPQIGTEVVTSAPKPSVQAVTQVLAQYQEKLQHSFPYGGNSGSDYAFHRVKHHLTDLIDALTDYTPQYLPPNENQATVSLSYLDVATKVIHGLPEWDSPSNRQYKDNAYDVISRAWVLVISEASKRGGGFQLHTGGWDQILFKHNEQSRGRMHSATSVLGSNLDWMGVSGTSNGLGSIRDQLFNGTYGNNSVSVGAGIL